MKLQKNHIQIIAILVAGILIGSIVFILSASYNKNKYAAPLTTVPTTTQMFTLTTTEPQTSKAPKETTNSTSATEKKESEASNETTVKSVKLVVPSTKNAIITAYLDAVNKLKNTDNFSLALQDNLKIEIDDFSGGSSAKKLVQKLVDQNAKKEPQNLKFVNGVDSKGSTPNQIIAPRNMPAAISSGNVVSASAKKESDKTYKVTINLGKQTQTLDSAAPGYATVTNTVDPATLDLPRIVSISEMNVTYNNSSIEAVIDAEGNLISMTHNVEVPSAEILGSVSFASVSLKIHGTLSSTYAITY